MPSLWPGLDSRLAQRAVLHRYTQEGRAAEPPEHEVIRISGLVVEYIVAIDVTRVRFPADAYLGRLTHRRRGGTLALVRRAATARTSRGAGEKQRSMGPNRRREYQKRPKAGGKAMPRPGVEPGTFRSPV